MGLMYFLRRLKRFLDSLIFQEIILRGAENFFLGIDGARPQVFVLDCSGFLQETYGKWFHILECVVHSEGDRFWECRWIRAPKFHQNKRSC